MVYSSNKIDEMNGNSRYDINVPSVIAFREIGLGLSAIEIFCCHMNFPPPMRNATYTEIVEEVQTAYVSTAKDSMSKAASEARFKINHAEPDSVVDIYASFDGSWQRRGYASLNDIVTAIERVNDKCIDIEVKTKVCKSCTFWEKKKGTDNYHTWKETHKCMINHIGSASSMESESVVSMFSRSIMNNKMRYKTFICDGDSASYNHVVKSDPYPGLEVKRVNALGLSKKTWKSFTYNAKEIGKGL